MAIIWQSPFPTLSCPSTKRKEADLEPWRAQGMGERKQVPMGEGGPWSALSACKLSHMSPLSSVCRRKTFLRLCSGRNVLYSSTWLHSCIFPPESFLGKLCAYCVYHKCDESGGEQPPAFPPAVLQRAFGLSLSEPFRISMLWVLEEPCTLHDLSVVFASGWNQG